MRSNENFPYQPSSPYSASKASADHLVRSFYKTYKIPSITTHCSNNFGPYQHEEKFIPKIIKNALKWSKIPIYGEGKNIRDWIYVKDNVKAIMHIIKSRVRNECFNIGIKNYIKNIDVVMSVLNWFDKGEDYIQYVDNRWGQDVRYSIDNKKILDLGWKPEHSKGIYKWHEDL